MYDVILQECTERLSSVPRSARETSKSGHLELLNRQGTCDVSHELSARASFFSREEPMSDPFNARLLGKLKRAFSSALSPHRGCQEHDRFSSKDGRDHVGVMS